MGRMDEIPVADQEAVGEPTRQCRRCGVTRPLTMFYIEMEARRAAREGRKQWQAPCRMCQREINMARIQSRRDYFGRSRVQP